MSERIQVKKSTKEDAPEVVEEMPAASESASKEATAEVLSDIDAVLEDADQLAGLLDEVDELMADINAQEFVKGYVQKGGQ